MRLDSTTPSTLADQRDRLAEHLAIVCASHKADPALAERVVRAFDRLDRTRFEEIEAAITGALDGTDRPGAYLDVATNLVKAMRLYLTFIERNKRNRKVVAETKVGRRILDIGSGSGSFAFLSKVLGHEVSGLDVPPAVGLSKDERFTEGPVNSLNMNYALMAWYGIPVIEHAIRPQTPLPVSDGSFDDFVIFYPTFHRLWTERDWDFLFGELSRCSARADSALYLHINTDKMKKTGRHVFSLPEFAKALEKLEHVLVRERCYMLMLGGRTAAPA